MKGSLRKSLGNTVKLSSKVFFTAGLSIVINAWSLSTARDKQKCFLDVLEHRTFLQGFLLGLPLEHSLRNITQVAKIIAKKINTDLRFFF